MKTFPPEFIRRLYFIRFATILQQHNGSNKTKAICKKNVTLIKKLIYLNFSRFRCYFFPIMSFMCARVLFRKNNKHVKLMCVCVFEYLLCIISETWITASFYIGTRTASTKNCAYFSIVPWRNTKRLLIKHKF